MKMNEARAKELLESIYAGKVINISGYWLERMMEALEYCVEVSAAARQTNAQQTQAVICSDHICDYCEGHPVNACPGYCDIETHDKFKGRKLSPC